VRARRPASWSTARRGAARLRVLAALCLCLAGGLASAQAADDGPVRLSPDQLRAAAGIALTQGDSVRALAYAEALVDRDPTDLTAQLIRARALRDTGRIDEAKAAARAAWALTDDATERYHAAMVRAQVLSTAGQKTAAQIWLRRAVQAAPDDRHEARAIRDFRYLRATNPWSTRVSFSITPDSNINNGSASRTSFLNYRLTEKLFGEPVEYQLTGSALALSGIEYAFGLDTRYRFRQTADWAQDLFLSTDLRTYTLSPDAQATAPDAKGSDFAFASVQVGYGYRRFGFGGRGETALRLDAGTSWYGGDPYARFLRANAIQTYRLTPITRIGGRLGIERQDGIATADSDTLRAGLWRTRQTASGGQWTLNLLGAVARSPSVTQDFTETGLRATVLLGQTWMGTDVQLGAGLRGRRYDVSPHSPDGRQDLQLAAEMTLIFSQIDYFGFNPVLTLSAARVDSNIALYRSERVGLNLGIQSAF
jgi:tetratricopeptide (TPR) repeat protein